MKYLPLILSLCAPLAACAITTTLEYEDLREATSRAAITNEINSATNNLATVAHSGSYLDLSKRPNMNNYVLKVDLADGSMDLNVNGIELPELDNISDGSNTLSDVMIDYIKRFGPSSLISAINDDDDIYNEFFELVQDNLADEWLSLQIEAYNEEWNIASTDDIAAATNALGSAAFHAASDFATNGTYAAEAALALKANDADVLKKNGDQTLNGALTAVMTHGLVSTVDDDSYAVGVKVWNGGNHAVKYLADGIYVSTDGGMTYTKLTLQNHDGILAIASDISSALTNATNVLATVAHTGAYSDLSGAPTAVGAFTNDAGYLTEHQSLAGYATETWVGNQGYLTSYTESDPNAAGIASNVVTQAYIQEKLGVYLYVGQDGGIYVHTNTDTNTQE